MAAAQDIEQGIAEGGTTEKQKLKKVANHTPMEVLSGGVAAVSVATSVAAMVLNPATPVYVAGALSSVIGPYAYYQQTKLTDIIALKVRGKLCIFFMFQFFAPYLIDLYQRKHTRQ